MTQDRARQTRARLVQAAAELFDRHGYTGTSMAGVAARADVTKGALYFHFATKTELVRELNEESGRRLRGYAVSIGIRRLSPLQALVDLSHGLLGSLRTEPVIRATLRVARECGGDGAPFLDFQLQWAEAVTGLLRRAGRDHWLAPGIDPDACAGLLLAVHIGLDSMLSTMDSRLSALVELTRTWAMILPGVVAGDRLDRVDAAGSAGRLRRPPSPPGGTWPAAGAVPDRAG